MTSAIQSVPRSIDDPVLGELIDQVGQRLQAGESVDVEALVQEHPQYAESLRRLLPALQVLADFSRSAERAIARGSALPEEDLLALGDFRIVREIGRHRRLRWRASIGLAAMAAIAVGGASLVAATSASASSSNANCNSSPTITVQPFGAPVPNTPYSSTPQQTFRYTLTNCHGMQIRLLTYGAITQSITAPDRICAPTSEPFSTTTTAAAALSCLSRIAAASPAGPAPTMTTSNSIASRAGRSFMTCSHHCAGASVP